MGIYIGPENEEQPKDAEKYEWSKYGGDSSYIDIRYSNDGETFTENNGLEPGSWIGFYITEDPSVMDPNYIPIWSNYEPWTRIESTAQSTSVFIDTDYNNIYKFLSSDGKYSYTPASISISLKSSSLQGMDMVSGNISYYYTFLKEDGSIDESMSQTPTLIENNSYNLSLTQDVFRTLNLQHIVIQGYYNDRIIATKILQVDYGTSKDMAQLSLNAANIVALIQDTTLTFDTNGLSIKNGGISVFNNKNEKVFYVDDTTGDLYFSGEMHSKSGTLGGWYINEHGLYASNETVGLYAGGDLSHPNDPTKTPIRFWAGKYTDNGIDNYHFAVNHEGQLFANKADIAGKIIAQDGHIENRFLVGSTDNGIIIFGGNEEEDSYIGSSLYSSGPLGYGWKLSQDGTAEFNNIIARGKIQSSVFEYNKISSVGGSLYIAPTIYIEEKSQPIITSIETIHNQSIECFNVKWTIPYPSLSDLNGRDWKIGDEVKLDGNILNNNGRIELSNIDGVLTKAISNSDGTTTITISFSTSQYNESLNGMYFQPGAILILYGSDEMRHGLFLTAAGSTAPYMDVYDDSEDNTVKPAVRLGNLSGVNDANFPEAALSGYGLYSSNAYLRGQLMLPGAGITNQTTIYYGEGDAASPIRIWAGFDIDAEANKNITDANFIVTANGHMYAKQGIFEGTVKAYNSEFSGTIKAAGIVIDKGSTGTNVTPSKNHFFVAYNDNPQSFHDYVLDIGQHGLSVWEGGLRAYSDYASGYNNVNYTDPIYGYTAGSDNPLPYFTLADDGEGNQINPRIVAYKGHFLTVKVDGNSYKTNSVKINEGIHFANQNFNNMADIERSAFYLGKGADIVLNEQGLDLSSENNINLNPKNSTVINSILKVNNKNGDNYIQLNGATIREIKDANKDTIGIDIVIV